MKRYSMISRAFFRRPSIRDLVPDLKLVLTVLIAGCESHTGTYIPAGLGEDCGFDPTSLAGALTDLDRRGHILMDKKTGEVFILAYYRDNVFKTAQRYNQWLADFNQIESEQLCYAVLEAIKLSPECGISVDNFPKTPKKHKPTSLGLAGVAGLKKASSSFSAASTKDFSEHPEKRKATISERLDELRAAGSLTKDCNLEKDRVAIDQIRSLAAWLSDEVVLATIALVTYPSQALKACREAGLYEKAAEVQRAENKRVGEAAEQDLISKTVRLRSCGTELLVENFGAMLGKGVFPLSTLVKMVKAGDAVIVEDGQANKAA